MALSKTLIELAMISPKSYAERIRERNLALQAKLMLLKPYLRKRIDEIPDQILSKAMESTHNGCPHCDNSCSECLWTKATHNNRAISSSCYNVKFNGVSYEDVSIFAQASVRVVYFDNSEYINIHPHSSHEILLREEWEKCMVFIDGHIEWTELDCWGAKYKE